MNIFFTQFMVNIMDKRTYQQLLAQAKTIDYKLEKSYGENILIPRRLVQREVGRLKQLEDEINEVKIALKKYGIEITGD